MQQLDQRRNYSRSMNRRRAQPAAANTATSKRNSNGDVGVSVSSSSSSHGAGFEPFDGDASAPNFSFSGLAPASQTKLCEHWKRHGSCTYGETCWYAHGERELRRPTGMFSSSQSVAQGASSNSSQQSTFQPQPLMSLGFSGGESDKEAKTSRATVELGDKDDGKPSLLNTLGGMVTDMTLNETLDGKNKRSGPVRNVNGLTLPTNAPWSTLAGDEPVPLSPAQERWVSMSSGLDNSQLHRAEQSSSSASGHAGDAFNFEHSKTKNFGAHEQLYDYQEEAPPRGTYGRSQYRDEMGHQRYQYPNQHSRGNVNNYSDRMNGNARHSTGGRSNSGFNQQRGHQFDQQPPPPMQPADAQRVLAMLEAEAQNQAQNQNPNQNQMTPQLENAIIQEICWRRAAEALAKSERMDDVLKTQANKQQQKKLLEAMQMEREAQKLEQMSRMAQPKAPLPVDLQAFMERHDAAMQHRMMQQHQEKQRIAVLYENLAKMTANVKENHPFKEDLYRRMSQIRQHQHEQQQKQVMECQQLQKQWANAIAERIGSSYQKSAANVGQVRKQPGDYFQNLPNHNANVYRNVNAGCASMSSSHAHMHQYAGRRGGNVGVIGCGLASPPAIEPKLLPDDETFSIWYSDGKKFGSVENTNNNNNKNNSNNNNPLEFPHSSPSSQQAFYQAHHLHEEARPFFDALAKASSNGLHCGNCVSDAGTMPAVAVGPPSSSSAFSFPELFNLRSLSSLNSSLNKSESLDVQLDKNANIKTSRGGPGAMFITGKESDSDDEQKDDPDVTLVYGEAGSTFLLMNGCEAAQGYAKHGIQKADVQKTSASNSNEQASTNYLLHGGDEELCTFASVGMICPLGDECRPCRNDAACFTSSGFRPSLGRINEY